MPSDRRRRLVWLIAIRTIVSTLLLGSGLLVQINAPGSVPVRPFFFLIGLSFALSLVHALLVQLGEWPWLEDLQLAGDAVVVSGIVAVTGGVSSYFALLYVLPIIAAAALQRRRGAITVAVLSSLVYGALVYLEYDARLEPLFWDLGALATVLPAPRVAGYVVAVNVFAFMAVAALAGSLVESLRRVGDRLEWASTEIANLQAFNQDVIDSLTSGLLTTQVNGRVLTMNRAAEKILGSSASAVTGRDVSDVLQLPAAATEALRTELGGARSWRAEFPYRGPDGATIEIGMAVAHLVTPGGKLGFLITFQDVTEIKRLERDGRMKQRLAAVGEMAAGMAHEIRNPLASMAGSIQVLREELTLNEEQAQLMDIVLRESTRLNDTIKNFLAYARPQRTALVPLDFRKVVGDTAKLLRNSSEVRESHTIEATVPDEEAWYEADEGQMRQILWNLATNGLRAMPDGGTLRLGVRLLHRDPGAPGPDPAALVLDVEDHGVGMPPEELDGIFQPFRGTFAGGSGLGLAIVHRIVSDHEGEIQVSSAVGKGTTVSVRFPASARGPFTSAAKVQQEHA